MDPYEYTETPLALPSSQHCDSWGWRVTLFTKDPRAKVMKGLVAQAQSPGKKNERLIQSEEWLLGYPPGN